MSDDRPITARELARLLRAFATMIENAEPVPEREPRRRSGRKRRDVVLTPAEAAEVSASVDRALRRHGRAA